MKKLITSLCFCIILISCSSTNARAEEGVAGISITLDKIDTSVTYNYTTDRVNLRKEASINSDIILTLDKRVKVKVLKKTSSDNWVNIMYDDKMGYVNSKYLRENELFTSDKNKWGIELTEEEIDLLAKIVWLESQGEKDKGQQAVVEVILNRMVSMNFKDTLYGVLSEKKQFSTWKNRNKAEPTEKEYNNINKVLNDETSILTIDTVFFATKPRNKNIVTIIGGHYFCKENN